MWCVGILFQSGKIRSKCFDDEEEALLFAAESKRNTDYRIFYWEI